jgi:hypothetical protein
MNSIATYQDSNTAWISSEGMLSWVTSTVYERFAGGGYMSGIKVVRGYSEPSKTKDEKRPGTPPAGSKTGPLELDETQRKLLNRRSAPPSSNSDPSMAKLDAADGEISRQAMLTRKFSNLLEGKNDEEEEEEAIRQRQEEEIQDDYNARAGETQGREIEHLVLVTHGIGQLLSLR